MAIYEQKDESKHVLTAMRVQLDILWLCMNGRMRQDKCRQLWVRSYVDHDAAFPKDGVKQVLTAMHAWVD